MESDKARSQFLNSASIRTLRPLRVRLDRDHGFQSIVIINSRAS
jgi:hypothetical protein